MSTRIAEAIERALRALHGAGLGFVKRKTARDAAADLRAAWEPDGAWWAVVELPTLRVDAWYARRADAEDIAEFWRGEKPNLAYVVVQRTDSILSALRLGKNWHVDASRVLRWRQENSDNNVVKLCPRSTPDDEQSRPS